MKREVELHFEYENMSRRDDDLLRHELEERRKSLLDKVVTVQDSNFSLEEHEWLARSFPVLSILAPVMSTNEGKIEFPGDPMCLYSALSYAVDQAVKTRRLGLSEGAPYNDLCPQWGALPSADYRAAVDVNGIRDYHGVLLNTDQTVFDPRVWNGLVKKYFVEKVLLVMR
ncbi:MAG TPA: hypothetical protein PKM54_13450, partial [Anaerolineales bacterium]|nr:hypothetical protein [Anaerolineales bacterium]